MKRINISAPAAQSLCTNQSCRHPGGAVLSYGTDEEAGGGFEEGQREDEELKDCWKWEE